MSHALPAASTGQRHERGRHNVVRERNQRQIGGTLAWLVVGDLALELRIVTVVAVVVLASVAGLCDRK